MSIPPAKLNEIIDICSKWTSKKYCTKRQLQSLLDNLLYISKCVKASRFYLNRLLDVLGSIEDKKWFPLLGKPREILIGSLSSSQGTMGSPSLTKNPLIIQLNWMQVSRLWAQGGALKCMLSRFHKLHGHANSSP